MRLIEITLLNIKKIGFFRTFYKILKYPYSKLKNNRLNKKIFSTDSNEDRFTKIYKLNYWNNEESVSGSGSNLESTNNVRNKLPQLINQFEVTSILDAPCGDFRKMDIFSEPFNFKKNYLLSIEDRESLDVTNHKFLYLFSREQINEFIKVKNNE